MRHCLTRDCQSVYGYALRHTIGNGASRSLPLLEWQHALGVPSLPTPHYITSQNKPHVIRWRMHRAGEQGRRLKPQYPPIDKLHAPHTPTHVGSTRTGRAGGRQRERKAAGEAGDCQPDDVRTRTTHCPTHEKTFSSPSGDASWLWPWWLAAMSEDKLRPTLTCAPAVSPLPRFWILLAPWQADDTVHNVLVISSTAVWTSAQ